MIRVRLRSPSGQHTAELSADATIAHLKAIVFEKTGIAPGAQSSKRIPPEGNRHRGRERLLFVLRRIERRIHHCRGVHI